MASKHYTSFSLVFLAAATILLAGHAHGTKDLCQGFEHESVCRTLVQGLSDPHEALKPAIHQLIIEGRRALRLANNQKKNTFLDGCKENFSFAIEDLQACLRVLKNDHLNVLQKGDLLNSLSAVVSFYETCNDTYLEAATMNPSIKNPFGKIQTALNPMISTVLALATQLP